MANKKIGFIGVGLMGHGMAKDLVEKGFPLRVVPSLVEAQAKINGVTFPPKA